MVRLWWLATISMRRNRNGARVTGWHNIIGLYASQSYTIGLKANGTTIVAGADNESVPYDFRLEKP